MNPDYTYVQVQKENLFSLRLKSCVESKTEPWTMEDIELAIKIVKMEHQEIHMTTIMKYLKDMLQKKTWS